MKRMMKIMFTFLLVFVICISIFFIDNVCAATKFENDSNSFLTSVLNGEYEYDIKGNKTTSEFFDGNYILLCKYKVKIKNTALDVNANLYYSLKKGSRGIYTVIYHTYTPAIYLHKGTPETITGNRIFGRGQIETGFANARKNLKKQYGNYFVVETEDKIIEDLTLGKCPYYAYYVDVYTIGYGQEGEIQTAQGFTSNKDGAKYEATSDFNGKMSSAIKKATEKIGTLDTAREYDINTLSLKSVNINTVAGALYQRVYSICHVNNDVNNLNNDQLDELTKPAIEDALNKASKIYEEEWELSLISTKNGLSDSEITALSLPNLIKDGNKYKEGYNSIVDELHNVVQAACVTDKHTITSNCEECPLDDEEECRQWTAKCYQLNDEANISENKDKNINNTIFEEEKFIIANEEDKPRGCDVFGEKTTPLIKYAYNLLKYGAPILVIIMGILDFAKAFMSGEEKGFKEAWQKFIKRIIAAVVVILLPVLITFILDLSGVLKQYGIKGKGNDIYCIFK